ncbi:hypothetical protein PAXRUDRAFT_826194, partial [Paxillus rubicundulus Ve08.2h10]
MSKKVINISSTMPVLEPVFEALERCGLSVLEFVLSLLTGRKYNDHPAMCDLLIQKTAAEASGWHFGAYRSTTKQLEDFNLEKMAKDMEASAPHFWSLLSLFLGEARDEIVGGGLGPDDRDAD